MRNRLHTWLPVVLSLVAFSAPAQDGTKLINAPTPLARRHLRPSFRDSLAEASRRLESPGCRLALSDSRDADGRTLADNLEATGLSAAEYLDRRIYFTGGRGLERCQASRILAATSPGSHVVFVCDVLHHVPDRAAWLGKVAAEMRPGARLVLIEFREGQLPEGPPESAKISRAQILDLAAGAGLALTAERADLLPYQTFLVFRKP